MTRPKTKKQNRKEVAGPSRRRRRRTIRRQEVKKWARPTMKKQTKEAVRPSRREPRTTVSSAQQRARVAQAGRCASPAGARARGAARGRGAVRGLSSATGESRARAAASRAFAVRRGSTCVLRRGDGVVGRGRGSKHGTAPRHAIHPRHRSPLPPQPTRPQMPTPIHQRKQPAMCERETTREAEWARERADHHAQPRPNKPTRNASGAHAARLFLVCSSGLSSESLISRLLRSTKAPKPKHQSPLAVVRRCP